jgi:type I restriction enzyme M protein
VRKDLVDSDMIEAIVQLPSDLFYGAMIPACVMVCNRMKEGDRKGRVLLIDGSAGFERRDTKNVLTQVAIARVAGCFINGSATEGFSAWATREEIVARRYDLAVRRYVSVPAATPNGRIGLETAVAAYREARAARSDAEDRLEAVLASLEESRH